MISHSHAAALELLRIEKSFGGVRALRGASLEATSGEIHGLCGENGAGKSTLLKILSGVYPRSSYGGSVKVHGQERVFANTHDAERAGIAIVHQELMLVPALSVAANLLLGHEGGGNGILGLRDDDEIEAQARTLLSQFGVDRDIDVETPVGQLGIGLQQVVEIVRALSHQARILILDEPTAALTGRETGRLMDWLRELRAAGTTCIVVSHRMDEVFALCDRVTVLRDGETVGTVRIGKGGRASSPVCAKADVNTVVAMMVGRPIESAGSRAKALRGTPTPGDAVLEVKHLSVPLRKRGPSPLASLDEGRARAFAVEDMTLSVRSGEVLAVCGALGSGRSALLSALFGAAHHGFTGSVRIWGREIPLGSPRAAIAAGLALIPEDRKALGLVLGLSVSENLSLPPPRSRIARALEWMDLVDEDGEEAAARKQIDELKIRGGANAEVGTLSGGNQQKVVLGKWLTSPPDVLLLDEPTRGVDIGAREEIYRLLDALSDRGTAMVLASSDLTEVLRLSHRILVLRDGRRVAELDGRKATEEQIVAFATGANDVSQTETAQTDPVNVRLTNERPSSVRLEEAWP